ncbi:MAG: TatD family hydrolase [bacterium]|jgi:TatD DNase family protein|nr:TatD family hydrolase [bacterium]
MPFFDSHCHLNHPDFAPDAEAVWETSRAQGVDTAIVIGYNLASSHHAVELAERLPGLYASVGLSPHDIRTAPSTYLSQLQSLAIHPKVAAIGETGLEYNYDVGPKDLQQGIFQDQIHLANELGKPVVIHLRDADQDFLSLLDSTPPQAAILHCFTASIEVMQVCVQRGYAISLSGIVTFKNAKSIHAIVPHIPEECLLIETDAPYLAPIPYRGKRCKPWMIEKTAAVVAQLREQSVDAIMQITHQNATRIFQLSTLGS